MNLHLKARLAAAMAHATPSLLKTAGISQKNVPRKYGVLCEKPDDFLIDRYRVGHCWRREWSWRAPDGAGMGRLHSPAMQRSASAFLLQAMGRCEKKTKRQIAG